MVITDSDAAKSLAEPVGQETAIKKGSLSRCQGLELNLCSACIVSESSPVSVTELTVVVNGLRFLFS